MPAASLSIPSDLHRVPKLHAKRRGETEVRIPLRLRRTLVDMAWNGLSVEAAAERHAYNVHALKRALAAPHVRAALLAEVDVLKTSARPMAARRIISLAERADSDKVSLDAAKWLDSNGKADQHAINVQVNVQQPGYVIAVDPRYEAEAQQTTRLAPPSVKPLK